MTMVRMQAMTKLPTVTTLIAALFLFIGGRSWAGAAERDGAIVHVSAAGTNDGDGTAARPMASLAKALVGPVRPGTTIEIDEKAGPLVEDVAIGRLCGESGRPIVIRAKGNGRAMLSGRLLLSDASHVVLERLAIEPRRGDASGKPCVTIAGADVELRDVTICGATGDGLDLDGDRISVRGGDVAACERRGVVARGSVRLDGLRVTSCRQGALQVKGDAVVSNCLLLHNRGPALTAEKDAAVRFYHNLAYDNSGGPMLDACRQARVLNNIFVNNFATTLLGEEDVELSVLANAEVDHNVYFRHPGKDKLLRGLPYAEGVDLNPLRAGNSFGLRLRVGRQVVTALSEKPWAERFDAHSPSLDILQRLTGRNSYTRSYEDLFVDFQQEDFRPRHTSPAVGRGADLCAEVPADCQGRPRSAKHPDVGPYAVPAAWWEEIDAGRATIVDGSVGLDAEGRDRGLGSAQSPFATLAKAAAMARRGSRIYVKDSIYRHTAMQTTFSLGPDSLLSGFPGHRPVFSPSESVEPDHWEQVTPEGLYRIRDWHTFLGSNCRLNAWMQDFYGNSHIGGLEENKTSLSRNRAKLAEPFRPIRFLTLDRDTPQVLADGVALQQAGGVLGLEEFGIGTMSAWGRDLSHLRPGSFMVGRRDWLLSKAVGKGPLEDGQILLEGPNRYPEMNYRIDGHAVGYVSQFVARPAPAWHAVFAYPDGDRLWKLDPAVTAQFGRPEKRLLKDGWRQVASDKESAWWVRQFALPAFQLSCPRDELRPVRSAAFRRLRAEKPPEGGTTNSGKTLTRHEGPLPRSNLPIGGWRQRQYQTGDPALAAVFDNPYQDCLEVRLPTGIDPNQTGLEVSFFSARVEAVWRKAVEGNYTPGVNSPGLAMLSVFRTMEARATLESTAATAGEPWQFGFLVPLGETAPQLVMRMPAKVDPNAEDPWKFTVVDDSLYVFLPGGDSPKRHSIEVACNSTSYMPHVAGSNSSFYDWEDAGPLRPDWPAVRVYRAGIDFGSNTIEPLWAHGEPIATSPGFELDPTDPTGRTLRLADEVRLGEAPVGQIANLPGQVGGASGQVGNLPHVDGDKLLVFRYYEGDPRTSAPREHRLSSRTLGPDRRVVLPTKPAAFPSRYAFFLAPAQQPASLTEQMAWNTLKAAVSRVEMAQGTYFYDPAGHALYVCLFPGSEPALSRWGGGRSDPFHTIRGLYVLGGNAYGHQKQYGWGAGLGAPADVYDDISVGFSPGHTLSTVPGSVVRDCTFRWAGADVGRGGEVSGFERHTADRIGRPELHVDHCVFDVSNAFLFDLNDNPTKNIPFANHHIWERSYFLPGMCGTQGPWWDQYCFNNVVQGCVFAGRGGVDVEVSENLIVRNNIFATDKGSSVTFRGSDRGYAINNTTFRGGGIWFHSEPERANATEQGAPCYGPSFPLVRRGPVPWLTIEPLRHEKGISLDVRWITLKDQPEVYYCENWDQPSPMLIDAKGFASYRAVGSLTEMGRGTYYHDPAARRLYLRLADGSSPQSAAVPPPHIPQTEEVRRDLVYTLTVIRPGRLSIPHRMISKTELEVLEPLRTGQSVEVLYYDSNGRRVERFAISAEILTQGRPRLRLSREPADGRLFVGLEGERPPLVRVTGTWTDVRPFEAELVPGASILASSLMGMEFHVLKGHFPVLNKGDQFESVFHSRTVYHLASLNNVFLDVRSTVAADAMDNPHHGANYLLYSERSDASHSRIDYNCYWKDLQAAPGPLSAFIHWGKPIVSHSTAEKEGITLAEFREKTGYEAHGIAPPSYFNLVANPMRFDFRPLPDSPLLGAGAAVRQQVGTFLFDPDEANGNRRFTFKGNDRDMLGQPRGERPTLGAIQNPLPGARAYYIAPEGKDSPDRGSRTAPWASFAYSLARMRPGDLLVLLPGVYREPLVVNRSGTAQEFLHIVAENPPYPTPAKFPTRGPSVIDAAARGAARWVRSRAHRRPAGNGLPRGSRRGTSQHAGLRGGIRLRREERRRGHPRDRPGQYALRVPGQRRHGRIRAGWLAGRRTLVRGNR